MGLFTVRDSLLSEYAAVGFEYGYSVEAPEALVAWEAQFGDFANGAQIIIDNFLAAAEIKWGQHAGLVMLLPHGYEGQGPEHSSSRFERFLALCARGNMRVTVPSTAAQYFHLLRSQALLTVKRPLIVVTPKSMLRAQASRSPIEDLETGSFAHVLDDAEVVDPVTVRRIVLCSGKIAHEAVQRRHEIAADDQTAAAEIAIVRVEQLYPWPLAQLTSLLRAVRKGRRSGVAARGTREHGRLVVRACPPSRRVAATSAASSRQPKRIGQSRHRKCRAAPVGAGRFVAARHWLNPTMSWWTGRTWPPKDERFRACGNSMRP